MLSSSSAQVLVPRLHAWASEEDVAGANWATYEDSECIYPCEDLVQKGAGVCSWDFLKGNPGADNFYYGDVGEPGSTCRDDNRHQII
jgi:hypothetical protein